MLVPQNPTEMIVGYARLAVGVMVADHKLE
jgi:hypothetical protein